MFVLIYPQYRLWWFVMFYVLVLYLYILILNFVAICNFGSLISKFRDRYFFKFLNRTYPLDPYRNHKHSALPLPSPSQIIAAQFLFSDILFSGSTQSLPTFCVYRIGRNDLNLSFVSNILFAGWYLHYVLSAGRGMEPYRYSNYRKWRTCIIHYPGWIQTWCWNLSNQDGCQVCHLYCGDIMTCSLEEKYVVVNKILKCVVRAVTRANNFTL